METLIFIDTNILLDFYRYSQGGAVLPVLKHIDKSHDKIITGNQVEMEFKKNRQKVILSSLGMLKEPKWESLQIPVFLSEAQSAQVISKNRKEIIKQINKLQKRAESILRNPSANDEVYKCAQRLFKNGSQYNLSRDKKIRFNIRRLAWKRFILGYPPRKKDDTSIGDAINWEWIIHCSKEYQAHVVIATRDSDYGYQSKSEPILNDWLKQEFKDRVSRTRKIHLTNRLTHAFKLAAIKVKKKEIEEEERFVEESRKTSETILPQSQDDDDIIWTIKLPTGDIKRFKFPFKKE